MSKGGMKIEGEAELQRALANLPEEIERLVHQAVVDTVEDVDQTVQRKIKAGSSPSQPGQPPASESGDLVAANRTRILGPMRGEVSNTDPAAPHLEFGTQSMAARPVWRPTIEETAPRFRKRIEDALRGLAK